MPSKNKLLKQQEKEQQKEREEQEKLLDLYWNEGTNKKREKKNQEDYEKQMEKMKKAKEKQELIAQDMESTKNIGKVKKTKKVKGDDLDLLNKSLASAPKTRKQIEAEKKELEKLQKKERLEKERLEKQEKERLMEIEKRENEKKGINYSHLDIMDIPINNTLNNDDEEIITGIDNILETFNGKSDEKKYTFQDFYNEKLPIIKQEIPGLRLSQYRDKIMALWKKSGLNI